MLKNLIPAIIFGSVMAGANPAPTMALRLFQIQSAGVVWWPLLEARRKFE